MSGFFCNKTMKNTRGEREGGRQPHPRKLLQGIKKVPQSSRTGAHAEKVFFLRLVNPLIYFARINIDRVMNELCL